MTRRAIVLALVLVLGPLPGRAGEVPRAADVVRSGPPGCRAVAFTFDLCPVRDPVGFDAPLIDALRTRGIPATFFASGRWIERHDAQVRELLAVPFFELETHGERHRHLPSLDWAAQRVEIEEPVSFLRAHYGYSATLFRPPYGEYDQTTLAVAHEIGLRPVLWSAVSGDPAPHVTAARMLAALRPAVRDGGIVIFHANGRGHHTREVVEILHDELAGKGYRFATVTGLLSCSGAGKP